MAKSKKVLLLSFAVLLVATVAAGWYLSSVYTDCRMSDETFEKLLSQPVGDYVDADMIYADDERAIFYYLNGVFVYNYNNDKIEQMIDLEKLNCAINQHEPTTGITVHASSDGKKLALYNYVKEDEEEQFDNYIIYTKTGIAKKEAEPDIGSGSGSAWVSWAEADCWRSGRAVYVGNEMFYMELDDGAEITQLKLVAAGQYGIRRREFYPFDDK